MAVSEQQSQAIGNATVAVYAAIEVEVMIMVGAAILNSSTATEVYRKATQIITAHRREVEQAVLADTGILVTSALDDLAGRQDIGVMQDARQQQLLAAAAVMKSLEAVNRGMAQNAQQRYLAAVG